MPIKPKIYAERLCAGIIYHCEDISGLDYTLCGVSLDGDQTETELASMSSKIDCQNCLGIIKFCRNVSAWSIGD